MIGWLFPPLQGGSEQGFTNGNIETFRGEDLLDNLVREIIQNSLDARDKDASLPVNVTFDLINLSSNDDVFRGYSHCLDGCKQYWSQEGQVMDDKLFAFLERADATLNESEIPTLVVRDYNTTGLEGSNTSKSSPWKSLTNSEGTNFKNDSGSAGSYGIGKNASFACSNLSMVFYSTYATDNQKAFKGIARLATTLNAENKPTSGTGFFQNNDVDNNNYLPIFGIDVCHLRDQFLRTQHGTDIIILGFSEVKDWNIRIERAVIRNFYPAFLENRLIVTVSGVEINFSTLDARISEFTYDKEMCRTALLLDAFRNPDLQEYLTILEDGDVEVFIKKNPNALKRTENFRKTGMFNGYFSLGLSQRYSTLLIVRGEKLNTLLKKTEPPTHKKWDYNLIDQFHMEERLLAKNSIQEIKKNFYN